MSAGPSLHHDWEKTAGDCVATDPTTPGTMPVMQPLPGFNAIRTAVIHLIRRREIRSDSSAGRSTCSPIAIPR
ncbi:hypothetical protein ABZ934_31205 [Streptomyces sp. NPDC046557]|uniref:hypothetical protein n=1 Tax=Streptomyces sp. NPDC046557 TaxID=3155372 RepID=UPI00340DA769